MEKANQELVIILPEGMEQIPVRIIRNQDTQELRVHVVGLSTSRHPRAHSTPDYAMVWQQNEYECISLNDITWIEANGSYCRIHTAGKRHFTISYPLARIEERLPGDRFIRVQRSFLVNIAHVKKLVGSSLLVDNCLLKIGPTYKQQTLDRFIFLGVHQQPDIQKKKTNHKNDVSS